MLCSMESFWDKFRSTNKDKWYILPSLIPRARELMIEIAIINKDWTRQATISPEGPKTVRFPLKDESGADG